MDRLRTCKRCGKSEGLRPTGRLCYSCYRHEYAEERSCAVCESPFTTYRFSKAQTCSRRCARLITPLRSHCPRGHLYDRRESNANRPDCKPCRRERELGITEQVFSELLESQGGACAICGGQEPKRAAMSVDHNHECCPPETRGCDRCRRGILCSRCNMGIGLLGDDPDVLIAAAKYLLSFPLIPLAPQSAA